MASLRRRQLQPRRSVPQDIPLLDEWRKMYQPAELELPHGYEGQATETCVVEDNGKILLALTSTVSVILDPLIRSPQGNPEMLVRALSAAEHCLAYKATEKGCVDAYVAVPIEEADYIRTLEKSGYQRTAQNCVILRRTLVNEPVPVPVLPIEEFATVT